MLRVLVVDDSWAMRKFVVKQVRVGDLEIAEVLEAGDGLEALGILAQSEVSVVITDINMPGMDGLELAAKMREDSALRGIPVILISSDAVAARFNELQDLGAIGYIEKPFTPSKLAGEIQRLFGLAEVLLKAEAAPA
jgi:two-component system chemotaxis response regulator CheY